MHGALYIYQYNKGIIAWGVYYIVYGVLKDQSHGCLGAQ